jgi:hypothetical protein
MQVVTVPAGDRPLTNAEIISGLKQALTVGADSAVAHVSKTDGYFRDAAIKILLPPEAEIITKNLSRLPGGERLIEDVILRINRAAEDAAKEAVPVFAGSIRRMTISDGFAILRGEDNAATQYLRSTTYDELFGLYRPKIRNSIDKNIVGDISTSDSWNVLTGEWNRIAASPVGQLAGFTQVTVKLDEYLTQRALDGLFLKIADQEKNIRENPVARVTDLLKRVFGTK